MFDNKICPYCAEEIKKDAIKCRYCGELLEKGQENSVVTKGEEPYFQDQGQFLISRKGILSKIPGFRSNILWKRMVAFFSYLIIFTLALHKSFKALSGLKMPKIGDSIMAHICYILTVTFPPYGLRNSLLEVALSTF